MEVSEHLALLQLDSLDPQFVDGAWDGEFIESVELPRECEEIFEQIDLPKVLHSFIHGVKEWLGEVANRSWMTLGNSVHHRELSALLFSLLEKGLKNVMNAEQRMCTILAARTYIVMCYIPGSYSFGVFHQQLYIQCLSCFKLGSQLVEKDELLEGKELDILHRQLKSLMKDLDGLIDCMGRDLPAEETVNCLVEFTGDPYFNCHIKFDKTIMKSLTSMALECLQLLVQPQESEGRERPEANTEIINLIFKALLFRFISSGNSTKKTMVQCHGAGVSYCKELLNNLSTEAMPSFIVLLQHLCYNEEGMERSDNRDARIKLVLSLLALLRGNSYTAFLQWIVKLSRNSLTAPRQLAVEIIGRLIAGAERNFDEEEAAGEGLPRREAISDNSSSEEDEEDEEGNSKTRLPPVHVAHKHLLRVVLERCQDVNSSIRSKALGILVQCTEPNNKSMRATIKEVFGDDGALLRLAEQRLKDEKVASRRTALILLENLLNSNADLVIKSNLDLMVGLCRDMSLMVRCTAVGCLTALAQRWTCRATAEAWLDGPMNQLTDPENKVKELVLESLKSLLFAPLAPRAAPEHTAAAQLGPWLLLAAIVNKNMRRHLHGACHSLPNSKIINNNLIELLYTHVGTDNNLCCWVLLSCLARYISPSNPGFALSYFNTITSQQSCNDVRLLTLVMEVLSEWSGRLGEPGEQLRESLLSNLQEGKMVAGAAREAVVLVARLSQVQNCSSSWAGTLLRQCEAKLLAASASAAANLYVLDPGGAQILITADVALIADIGPSSHFILYLEEIITSSDEMSVSTRASAVTALGKFSLKDRATAARAAPLCGTFLKTNSTPLPIKMNCMCVLADLCTRYTSIVEPQLSSLCCCLGSRDPSLRRVATELVTHLLVGGFLRLKDTLYFHYFGLICDEDSRIADIATYYIKQCLVPLKNKVIFYNFVDSMFYFNGYKGHLTFARFNLSEEERELFSLEGNDKRSSRLLIYDLMLSSMTDVQRLNIQEKLCKEIEAEGVIGNPAGESVLRDALVALRKAMKPIAARQPSDDMVTRVTANILSKKMTMNVVEMVVPTVLKLHRILKSANSPLLPDVVAYAGDLYREYKKEIEELYEEETDLLDAIKLLQANSDLQTPHRSSRNVNTPGAARNDGDSDAETARAPAARTPGRSAKRRKFSHTPRNGKTPSVTNTPGKVDTPRVVSPQDMNDNGYSSYGETNTPVRDLARNKSVWVYPRMIDMNQEGIDEAGPSRMSD